MHRAQEERPVWKEKKEAWEVEVPRYVMRESDGLWLGSGLSC